MISTSMLNTYLRDDLDVDFVDLTDDSALFSSGIIDSFALVSLMALLEDKGGIRISPSDVNVENFDSITRMMNFVQSKQ